DPAGAGGGDRVEHLGGGRVAADHGGALGDEDRGEPVPGGDDDGAPGVRIDGTAQLPGNAGPGLRSGVGPGGRAGLRGEAGRIDQVGGRRGGRKVVVVAGQAVLQPGDGDPVRAARLDARLDGGADVVDVDMDVPGRRGALAGADDDERVAEPVQD